jgi:hypothetical protein
MKTTRDVGREPESTITRRINDFCSQARDTDRAPKADLFARVDDATYKLRGYPVRPNLIDIQDIAFSDPAFQYVWERFVPLVKEKAKAGWQNASHTKRLEVFIKNVGPGGALAYLFDDYVAFQAMVAGITPGFDSSPGDLEL